MEWLVLTLSVISTIFATGVLAYISMATMIGPWIAPTLVLIASVIIKLKRAYKSESETNQDIALIQTAGSVGGIVAMGVGFTLPTLYFLDPVYFNKWLEHPLNFCIIITISCLISGGLGIWLARIWADKFINKEKLPFPVSGLIYNVIVSQTQAKQAKRLLAGFFSTTLVCFLRDGFLYFKGIIPQAIYFFQGFFGKEIVVAIFPTLWAIGFIVGMKIAFPLLIGMLSKYIVLHPLNSLKFFSHLKSLEFLMAFCSGLVVSEFILGNLKTIKKLFNKIANFSIFNVNQNVSQWVVWFAQNKDKDSDIKTTLLKYIEPIVLLSSAFIFLYALGFMLIHQILFLSLLIIFSYQLSYLSAKIGLVPFGRFATFVMIPMLLLFKLDYFQITFVCVFFNICAGASSDLLFDYKVGKLCGIDFKRIYRFQWLGLIVTSLVIGFILLILFSSFKLGGQELFAQRAISRALLIQSVGFDLYVVLLGFLYGVVLRILKLSPTMVFGGLLMPNNLTIGLVIGALGYMLTKNPKEHHSFWSGVFAIEAVWMLLVAIFR